MYTLDLFKLLQKEHVLKDALREIIEYPNYLQMFSEIEPVSIIRFQKENYVEKLLTLDSKKLLKVHEIINVFIQKELGPLNNMQAFERKYIDSWLFIVAVFQSKLTDYYTYKYNHTPILKVNFLDEEPSEKLQKAESRIDNLLKEREKTLIQKNEIEQKFNLLKAEQKELQFQHKVIKEQHMKIQKLEQDLLYSKKKEALIGQELFVVGIEWHEEVLIKLNSKYHLKNVTCFSAIDQLNKLDALHNKIVVFSTSQASHQAFYKLKNNHSLQLIITNEQNPERVMRKVIESIEI